MVNKITEKNNDKRQAAKSQGFWKYKFCYHRTCMFQRLGALEFLLEAFACLFYLRRSGKEGDALVNLKLLGARLIYNITIHKKDYIVKYLI